MANENILKFIAKRRAELVEQKNKCSDPLVIEAISNHIDSLERIRYAEKTPDWDMEV